MERRIVLRRFVERALFAGALLLPSGVTTAQDTGKLDKLLSVFTPGEQLSIRNACAAAAATGPKSFDACIRTKVQDLKESPGPPDLSTLAPDLQDSIRNACRNANLAGPASYYDCLQDKATELRQSPGRPDLSTFSSDDQAAMVNACRAAESAGPARLYACLRTQIAELRRRPSSAPRVDAPSRNAVSPRVPATRATAPRAATSSRPKTDAPVAIVQPSLHEDSNRWWIWVVALLGLAAWPIARRFYQAGTNSCRVCNAPVSNAGELCDACERKAADDRRRQEHEAAEARFREPASARHRAQEASRSFDPYVVLGVARGATPDQVKAAYRTLIVQYHPDKVAQLGPELRQLAAEKSRQINDAYRMLERSES